MARMPRLVVPGYPHHVTQRGCRRMRTFFSYSDYKAYLNLVSEAKDECGIDIWAYCLMPNHVHAVVVPSEEDSLSRFYRFVHRSYTRRVNYREGWSGHLWQERFHSSVMDEQYLLSTVRYVELNPVRAHLCPSPKEWPWSSVHAHLAGESDEVVSVEPLLERISDWSRYLELAPSECDLETLRQRTDTGRPIGDASFIGHMEALSGRDLKLRKPGPKPIIE